MTAMAPEMTYSEHQAALTAYRSQIADIRRKMRELQRTVQPEPVADYVFSTVNGTVRSSELFGTGRDLL